MTNLVFSATVRDLSEVEASELYFAVLKIRDNESELLGFEQDGFWHVSVHELTAAQLPGVLAMFRDLWHSNVLVITRPA